MHTIVIWLILAVVVLVKNDEIPYRKEQSTDLANEIDPRLLLFSTLDGYLFAIEQHTGFIKWKIKDAPIVQVPKNTSEAIVPLYLPDPRDGSLYLIGDAKEPLKKLPFTIPELVASSPCRSSDGILYTGKKKDTWFSLDPHTGQKQQILGWESTGPKCPVLSPDSVYVGRTKYNIMMVDSAHAHRKWNVSYYEYSASPIDKESLTNYALVHFASSSTGRLVSMDKRTGSLYWDKDLGSPVVGSYLLDSAAGLLSLPFTSLAGGTLANLALHLTTTTQQDGGPQHNTHPPAHMKLYPTLYIGEHTDGLYALPSLVDKHLITITSDGGPLLVEGPPEEGATHPRHPPRFNQPILPGHDYYLPITTGHAVPHFESVARIIYLGHYDLPDYSKTRLHIAASSPIRFTKLLTDGRLNVPKLAHQADDTKGAATLQTDDDEFPQEVHQESETSNVLKINYDHFKQWVQQQDNKGLKLTLVLMIAGIIGMFCYLQMQVRGFQHLSQNGSQSSQNGSVGRHGAITATLEELSDGLVRIGKITFDPEQLLGKGCEGTFVYRGEFDSRRVAVKRLLPECFNFADREVALLRESDAHANVIRYYCTEQDRMFRYIALELCQATLHDYVQGDAYLRDVIAPLDILKQATAGLAHLHSLDIVHRDIKPHNVLLSMAGPAGDIRAMISDFGLCKKLQLGRMSFSRRSGVTGTDGWIAPEMLNGQRTTCAVDMFSLGCLFYYVLSNGAHPFGDSLHRQANILQGDFTLDALACDECQIQVIKPLLTSLLSDNPQFRPNCVAVLLHPMFWFNSTILSFFQDVSDRVEKAEAGDEVLETLETNGGIVVRGDWRLHIHAEVSSDLRKYRSYRGESLRDLLRALRNKKHHYRELSSEAQELLGEIPDKFITYWTSRFPFLLIHTWLAMHCVSNEKAFKQYYPPPPHHYPLILDYPQHMHQNEEIAQKFVEVVASPHKKNQRFNKNRANNNNADLKNVGLYRNANTTKVQNNLINLSDINVSLINDTNGVASNSSAFPVRKRGGAYKKKKPEVELVWVLPSPTINE